MKTVHTAIALASLSKAVFAHPSPYKPGFSWADTKYLITFGDSYTYVQGTHGLQNFSFVRQPYNISCGKSVMC